MISSRIVAALLALASAAASHGAEESFLKANDVIALAGGEDMAALAESGYLEAFLTAALPGDKLRFRNLAWEGDTVFEQRRDLNYPTLEQQLEKVGATVVVAQFGGMESLQGVARLAGFREAYGKLLERFGRRRLVLVAPSFFSKPDAQALPDHTKENDIVQLFSDEVEKLARERNARFVPPAMERIERGAPSMTRDGIHLSEAGQRHRAIDIARRLGVPDESMFTGSTTALRVTPESPLRSEIVVKNRLWFHYTRPQNWAFLAGDRTSQPSSRDHRDLNKRWFPEELEQFLPLIEKKEAEIWKLAAQHENNDSR